MSPSHDTPTEAVETSLGTLIAFFYEEFLAVFNDPELASVAAAAVINDMLAEQSGLHAQPLTMVA